MKYPLILEIDERHTDPWFYYCEDVEELKEASLHAFNCLQGRIEAWKPEKDYYEEVSDEMIEKAPRSVKKELKDLQEKYERWQKYGYDQALRDYKLFQFAEEGDGASAFRYLRDCTNHLKYHYPTEVS